jgi:hypothetical protein
MAHGRPRGAPALIARLLLAAGAGALTACRPTMPPRAPSSGAVPAYATAPALPPANGAQLELHLVLDAHRSELSNVQVALEWAGANAGPDRHANWKRVPLRARYTTLRPGRPTLVARGALPAGRYDRVFVALSRAWTAGGGERLPLVSHVEPSVLHFRLAPGLRVAVEIELVALPSTPPDAKGYSLFAKTARLTIEGRAP